MDKVQKDNASINPLAYKKIIYHCLRYSSTKVYGALIANKQTPNQIVDSFPLFHTPIINPTFGLALDLIQSNLSPDQQIAGFYQFIDSGDSAVNRIIDTNANLKGMKNLRLWMVDAKQIKFGMAGFNLSYPEFNSIKDNILKGQHHFIVDFDAHLQEMELDFTNSHIN